MTWPEHSLAQSSDSNACAQLLFSANAPITSSIPLDFKAMDKRGTLLMMTNNNCSHSLSLCFHWRISYTFDHLANTRRNLMRKLLGMWSRIWHDYSPSLLRDVSVVFSSHTHRGKPLYYIMECHHDTSTPFLP